MTFVPPQPRAAQTVTRQQQQRSKKILKQKYFYAKPLLDGTVTNVLGIFRVKVR